MEGGGLKTNTKSEESRAPTRLEDLGLSAQSSSLEESRPQPHPDRSVVETHPPDYNSSSIPTAGPLVAREALTRAKVPTLLKKYNSMAEDNQLDKTVKNDITVNGVSLMEMMKKKKTISGKKTTSNKKPPKDKNKKNVVLTPSTNSIRNYLTKRKQESSEDEHHDQQQEDNRKNEDHLEIEDNLQVSHGEDDPGDDDNMDNPRHPSPRMKMTFGTLPPPLLSDLSRKG